MRSALAIVLVAMLDLSPVMAQIIRSEPKPVSTPAPAKPNGGGSNGTSAPSLTFKGNWSIRFNCGLYSYNGTLSITTATTSAVRGARTNKFEVADIVGGLSRDREIVFTTAFVDAFGNPRRDEYSGLLSADGNSAAGTYVGDFDINDDCTWTAKRL